MDEEVDKSAKYKVLLEDRRPLLSSYLDWSIYGFIDMFRKIYEGRLHIQTLESIGFHFLEEADEAEFAVRKLSQLRNVHEQSIDGLDKAFLSELNNVESIVGKYDEFVKDSKTIWHEVVPIIRTG